MAEDSWYPDSDEEEDALLNRAYDRWEQLGGAAAARGPLFQFTMQPIGRRRRWRDVVERAQFNAQLRQLRDPVPEDNIGMALTEALHQAIETELGREQRPAHHFVNFAITAHGFTHAYQTANFTVGEFLQRTARLDEMLATLAGKLNSNEAFNPDRGFQVDVVFLSMPGPAEFIDCLSVLLFPLDKQITIEVPRGRWCTMSFELFLNGLNFILIILGIPHKI